MPRVAADPRLLRRVLLKLAGNAIKATDRGNIEITVDRARVEAGEGKQATPRVRLTVTDTGPGIPDTLQRTIFEPFAKGDGPFSRAPGGTMSVGLAATKRLVESAGGTIGVESEPGMGASFWFELPAISAASSFEENSGETLIAPSKLAFLLYLPEDELLRAFKRLLSPAGNVVTVAKTLAQASTMSVRGGFSVIIAAASGVETLAAVPGQNTPILAIANQDESKPQGANAVLRWPASEADIYAAILSIAERVGGASGTEKDNGLGTSVDAKLLSELEKSLGLKTLLDILRSYIETSEGLAHALSVAREKKDWTKATRLAQDFAGAAGGLGLITIAGAARLLAQGARDDLDGSALAAATEAVLAEHRRMTEALRRLYPDLAA